MESDFESYNSDGNIAALKKGGNIRCANDSEAGQVNDGTTNDSNINDTIIYYTKRTAVTTDDVIVMVLEDFTDELTIDMFNFII